MSEMLQRGRSLQAGCTWLRAALSRMHTGQEAYINVGLSANIQGAKSKQSVLEE